ncbi:50S ribosomal protein L11 methyltransferase [Winogradskyella aurantiaca]|uniref:50S ribosomal protein L11 methyltransferase n=1 Tax=Winogradskyella aurantiaca TaxID=2219558 RepID=UPI000E1D8058|nr:50S ribosomal protein L11 methyltransferase [Winogradskyella aurantiaca]
MENPVYIGYEFKVAPLVPGVEILMAELGYAGFESFVETEEGLSAYIQKSDWSESFLDTIDILKSSEFHISYEFEDIEQTNWNATWEQSFQPIVVDERCTVRAPFHDKAKTELDIIIEPKMSFGTGHHETTHMMIQFLLKADLKGKTILDMGCGTGVLAIIAEKLRATKLDAIDIDAWSYENSLENVGRNECHKISVYQGDVDLLEGKSYDMIIANINRNILLDQMESYAKCLNTNGVLFLSGFYKADISIIEAACNSHMLKLEDSLQRGEWVALKFIN